MTDFSNYLQSVEHLLTGAKKGLFAKFDHFTFRMVINGLKGDDYEAVAIVIDQLVKERRPVSIPPLYVVAKSHPNMRIRAKAADALQKLDPGGAAEKIGDGKEMQEAVKALVDHYGNYKTL